MYAPANSLHFSPAASGPAKLVLLGPPGALWSRLLEAARSLNDSDLICPASSKPGAVRADWLRSVAHVRHPFWSRKPQRGFVLAGFPTNLAQALVLEAWLDERDEALSAVVWLESSREDALAEATRRKRCPLDGSIAYAQTGAAPLGCARCHSAMLSDADRATAEIDHWFREQYEAARAVAEHFRGEGILVSMEATAAAEAALERFAELFTEQVTSR